MTMSKEMKYMLCFVGVLFGLIFSYKIFIHFMIKKMIMQQAPSITVSASQAEMSEWQPRYQATGSLRTINGVNVTTELAGIIRKIDFIPGSYVRKGDLLVQLDIDADIAQLKSLEAKAKFAKITWQRNKTQYKIGAISKEQLQSDEANYKSTAEQVKAQQATIAKKTIRAPFDGKLGISAVNIGEYLAAGQKIVTLQALDPLYADFNVPQEALAQFETGQQVDITVDTYPDTTFSGEVTTIEPQVDSSTRNIAIEATIPNSDFRLLPGMFAKIVTTTGEAKKILTLPQTAISFNSYGDIVYLLTEFGKDQTGKKIWKAHQRFVTTSERRGEQIAIVNGIKAGDMVVTSGQLKLKNDTLVTVNNSPLPANSTNLHALE